ncbi:hypothetical protein QBC40DRAFT_314022 [Triangularia verruculosa]|uniref:Uncharacterized protein n=1 Tax=Triangularia verruculosa TaxID=2587418 RepID=A0AAN6XBB5_9PEZI|nr:hypothetical protein QBC40DRAFT_314022 [Triangularia verruculosa]
MDSPTSSSEFAGDEFSNNLFSDLAPLLTLFGEQVTKQFLSLSLGWADNVLLAMGPLGIMTIIVSAIRVGGIKQLKAVVGRARESRSTAEQELLSSTSADVCEFWSGREIVRLIGNPQMKWLIIDRSNGELYDLQSAHKSGFISSQDKGSDRDLIDTVGILNDAAPNLALNVRRATASRGELWLWAMIGTVLQVTAIVFPGVTTYRWAWVKAGAPIAPYGYPCFVVGTLLVVVGGMGCGHVIEGITTEHNFKPTGSRDLQSLILQRSVTVADQHFASYAIFSSSWIRTSTLDNSPYESYFSVLAAASTITALVGFVIQFVGLRALHWSATILQLGITLVMTGVRAWARRGLAFDPVTVRILDGHERAWLALYLGRQSNRNSPNIQVPPK